MEIIVPISGGKDSTFCAVLARETGKKVTYVFNDTGWDHPLTYEYLDYLRDTLKIEIHSTFGGKRGKDLISLIRAVGRFPFGRGRFCTMYLKQYALRDWYRDNIYDGKTKHEIWYGMRMAESSQRKKRYMGAENDDVFDLDDLFPSRWTKKLRQTATGRLPIVEMQTDEVFEELKKRGIKHNPLYDEGTNNRVGCYPCLLAGKKVQKLMFATEEGQKRLEIIKGLEVELGQKYEMFDTDQGSCELCKI